MAEYGPWQEVKPLGTGREGGQKQVVLSLGQNSSAELGSDSQKGQLLRV